MNKRMTFQEQQKLSQWLTEHDADLAEGVVPYKAAAERAGKALGFNISRVQMYKFVCQNRDSLGLTWTGKWRASEREPLGEEDLRAVVERQGEIIDVLLEEVRLMGGYGEHYIPSGAFRAALGERGLSRARLQEGAA